MNLWLILQSLKKRQKTDSDMQDIIFSAYTTPKDANHEFNNTLVTGDLIKSGNKFYIHPRANTVTVNGEIGKYIIMHEVIPDTITYTIVKDQK